MKSLAVGAMLLHTMNAQTLITAPISLGLAAAPAVAAPAVAAPVAPAPALNAPAVNAPAPLLTPGIDAPSEAELLGPAATIASLLDFGRSPGLPTGTADVVLDPATSVVPSGAGSTPGTGISFGPNGSSVPNADVVPANVASPLATLTPSIPAIVQPGIVDAPVQNLPALVSSVVSSVRAAVSTPVLPTSQVQALPAAVSAVLNNIPKVSLAAQASAGFGLFAVEDPLVTDPAVADPTVADPTVVTDPAVVDPVAAVPADATASTGIVDNNPVEATSSATPSVLPVGAALPIGYDPYSIYDPNSPYYNPYSGPYAPDSIYDPYSPYYDPTAAPPGWEGEDNGIYDGEDSDAYQDGSGVGELPVYTDSPSYGGDEEEECPAWCIEDDSYPSYPTSTPDYQEYEPTPEYTPYPEQYPTPTYEEEYPTPTPDYESYSNQDDSNYPSQEPQYYPEPTGSSYSNKVRSIIRAVRRQAFSWPQPAYDNDDDSGVYDGEDGSIPDWLYDISGAPERPTPTYTAEPMPTCPASCYKPRTSAYSYTSERPTYTKTRKGGYETTEEPYEAAPTEYYPSPIDEPYETAPTDMTAPTDYYPTPTDESYEATPTDYYPSPTDESYEAAPTDVYYSPDETMDAPYAGDTSSAWYSQGNTTAPVWPAGPTNVPDMPTYVPEEPADVPEEPTSVPPMEPTTEVPSAPTTLLTQYQPQSNPEQTGSASSDPGSPAGDYTGDTLDTLCPNVCNPFNPAENFCDITTGCTTTGGSKYYCACRAGYRADNYNAKDFSKQFKVAGQPYVYLAVSTSCNTVCSDSTCSEVLERSQCK